MSFSTALAALADNLIGAGGRPVDSEGGMMSTTTGEQIVEQTRKIVDDDPAPGLHLHD